MSPKDKRRLLQIMRQYIKYFFGQPSRAQNAALIRHGYIFCSGGTIPHNYIYYIKQIPDPIKQELIAILRRAPEFRVGVSATSLFQILGCCKDHPCNKSHAQVLLWWGNYLRLWEIESTYAITDLLFPQNK